MYYLFCNIMSQIDTFEIVVMAGSMAGSIAAYIVTTYITIIKWRRLLKKDQENLFNSKADKITVDKEFERIDKKMDLKVDKTEVELYTKYIKDHIDHGNEEWRAIFDNYEKQHNILHKQQNENTRQSFDILNDTIKSFFGALKDDIRDTRINK